MINTIDHHWMQLAYTQAEQAIGLSSPNPRVGCVLVLNDEIVGEGHTQAVGQAHAEVMAIADAHNRGIDLTGCTAYVTLEPCSHFGRTPPCVEALKAIQPARIVVVCVDANPLVAGQGIAALRAAGVEVEVLEPTHPLAQKAFNLNIGFMRRMAHHQVYTRLKWASSIDGKTALPDGRSQWITDVAAREDGQYFRARSDAIVTGVGTVLHDDPQMNVRIKALVHPPIKVVVDTWLRTPLNARLFDDGAPVYLACADIDDVAQEQRIKKMSERYAQVTILLLPLDGAHVDLKALWAHLYEMQVNEVHVEAGAMLNGALLQAGLIDELLMYVAPRVIGSGFSVANFGAHAALDDLMQVGHWRWLETQQVGNDLRLRAQKITEYK